MPTVNWCGASIIWATIRWMQYLSSPLWWNWDLIDLIGLLMTCSTNITVAAPSKKWYWSKSAIAILEKRLTRLYYKADLSYWSVCKIKLPALAPASCPISSSLGGGGGSILGPLLFLILSQFCTLHFCCLRMTHIREQVDSKNLQEDFDSTLWSAHWKIAFNETSKFSYYVVQLEFLPVMLLITLRLQPLNIMETLE